MLNRNTWNSLTVCKKWPWAHLKMLPTNQFYKLYIYSICMCQKKLALDNLQVLICHKIKPYLFNMHKEDLALDNLQVLICHKIKPYVFNMYKEDLALNNLQVLICHKPNQVIYSGEKQIFVHIQIFNFLQITNWELEEEVGRCRSE